MRFRPWLSVIAVVSVLAMYPALAADGAIPIWEPTTITEPGHYVVTRNVSADVGPAISVQADDVVIDLNGFTVTGGIAVEGGTTPEGSFLIENGTVIAGQNDSGGWTGIYLGRFLNDATVRNLRLVGWKMSLQDSVRNAMIEDNVLTNAYIDIDIGSGVIRNNFIEDPPGSGIRVEWCSKCQFMGNTVLGAGGDGIFAICEDSRIANNLIAGGAADGILVSFSGSRNQIENNVCNSNGGFGLRLVDDENVYRGNTARGNGGTNCTGTSSSGDFCDEGTNNTSHGDNYLPGKM